jgi:hypothetical protein
LPTATRALLHGWYAKIADVLLHILAVLSGLDKALLRNGFSGVLGNIGN